MALITLVIWMVHINSCHCADPVYTNQLTVKMLLQPLENTWSMKGYTCGDGDKCAHSCGTNYIQCSFKCQCKMNPYVSTIITSQCKFKRERDCRKACFRERCLDVCHGKTKSHCRSITG